MKNEDQTHKERQAIRNFIARFIEDANADSVVVLWTINSKTGTKSKIASWGNQFAVRDMIKTANDDYCIERINAIKLKTKPKPNTKDEP